MKKKNTRTADYQENYLMNDLPYRPDFPGILVHSFCHSFLQPQWRLKLDPLPYISVSIILSGEDIFLNDDGDRIRDRPGYFNISDLNFGTGGINRKKEILERYFIQLRVNRFLRELLQSLFPAGLPQFMPPHPERLKRCFEDIRRILRRKSEIDHPLLGAAAFRLLCEAADQLGPPEPTPEALVKALHYIDNRFSRTELTRREIAAAAGISDAALGKLFQTHLHTTVNRYVLKLRVEKAGLLLKNSRHPVAEIARMCGFPHPCYFAKVFRAHTGLLPLAYRRSPETEISTP